MRPRILIVGLALCTSLLPLSVVQGQQSPAPDAQRLEQRVKAFYAALAESRFDDVYSFFGEGMRRDNPRGDYVQRLRSSVAGFKFGAPDVQVSVTGKNKRPLGVATVEIAVRTTEGEDVKATHRSYWTWQPGPPIGRVIGGGIIGPSRGPTDWYIASDEMQERQASASLNPILTIRAGREHP
jgi:hypothetical protein